MADLLIYGPELAYLGIIVCLALTGSGLPIPEEVFIIGAGIAAAQGSLDPWLAVGSCLIGALSGDCLMYWIGRHFGHSLIREHPWWARWVNAETEASVERLIARHGLKVFFVARFLVGLRSPVYLAAGVMRVPFRRFLLFDLICASIVIGTFFSLSYFLSERYGESIYHWIRDAEITATVIVVVGLVVLGIVWWRRHVRRQREETHRAAATGDSPPSESSAQQSAASDEMSREATDQPTDEPGDEIPEAAPDERRTMDV